jgi:ATP-dependent protease ClpP protease subunit
MVREIDRWFDLNLDTENRVVYLGSLDRDREDAETGVDYRMAEYFIKGMHVLHSKNNKPIRIIMNNPGGDWYHGMAIYDAIKSSTCECTIIAYGYAMSMGSIILQAADQRIMMPNSRFMMHYGDEGRFGHAKVVQKWSDEGKRINWQMENIYLDRMLEYEQNSGISLETALAELINRDNALEFTKRTPVKYRFSTRTDRRREQVREALSQLLSYDAILSPEETVSIGLADSIHS